ncbi:hypothetical protein CHO01_25060 [Cellulomonas hominis]|uniref:Uncharacterized protein n=1 Tax=Cellulomonas hominis TaxID=156981 RepID=A0A511FDQ6_9CELL|nr:CopG family transcriptional regulator [Cellulomonas hominis]GEL47390.1 hypothetical protein CHO01_25060 [Cellulomonas hominis]
MNAAARGAVLSLRLSESEQKTLRAAADARGTSVSDMVRALVAKELAPTARSARLAVTASGQPASSAVGQGVFWQAQPVTGSRGTPGGLVTTSSLTS